MILQFANCYITGIEWHRCLRMSQASLSDSKASHCKRNFFILRLVSPGRSAAGAGRNPTKNGIQVRCLLATKSRKNLLPSGYFFRWFYLLIAWWFSMAILNNQMDPNGIYDLICLDYNTMHLETSWMRCIHHYLFRQNMTKHDWKPNVDPPPSSTRVERCAVCAALAMKRPDVWIGFYSLWSSPIHQSINPNEF